tara:strand:+ start:3260 stop:3874 length:615 start_codon:yes stop_codon:yes gene_type:complete
MSIRNVISQNISAENGANPLLTRGEQANSVVALQLPTVAVGTAFDPTVGAGTTGLNTVTLTDGQASSSAFRVYVTSTATGLACIDLVYPATNDLAYNPNLYPVVHAAVVSNTAGSVDTNAGAGIWTARILFAGNYRNETGAAGGLYATSVIQLRRHVTSTLAAPGTDPAVVEVRLVEMPINDSGLNSDAAGAGANQIRDTVVTG